MHRQEFVILLPWLHLGKDRITFLLLHGAPSAQMWVTPCPWCQSNKLAIIDPTTQHGRGPEVELDADMQCLRTCEESSLFCTNGLGLGLCIKLYHAK